MLSYVQYIFAQTRATLPFTFKSHAFKRKMPRHLRNYTSLMAHTLKNTWFIWLARTENRPGFPASSCSVLHQRSLVCVQYDTILMKRDTHRLLHKSFPPHICMLGLTLQFASCSSHNSLQLCGEAGRQEAREGSRIVVMLSSEEFDNNLIRADNCADSRTAVILDIWDIKDALMPGWK